MKNSCSVHLTLTTSEEAEAAKQCLALMKEPDWRSLVAFSLAVVALQEQVATQSVYHFEPRPR